MNPHSYSRGMLTAWALVASAILPAGVVAQISTDSSLGRPAQSLAGPNYLIPESLGRLAGSNLFHSFQTFSINAGQSANFTTITPGLANVISRVTGGSLSQINGTLRLTSQGSTPNFFLINPAGVTFGSGATINVPGAFYVSTANYVRFPDGNFNSDTTTTSTFSSASPEAFGFLGNSSATVSAVNATPQNVPGQPARPSLFVGTDKPIHVVAGDVTINSSVIGNESGDVRIVALGRPSRETQVPLSGAFNMAGGSLQIINGGQINSSTNSAKDVGSVQVYAGNITIDKQTASRDTGIISQADPGSSGLTGDITLIATGDLSVANGGKISATNSATAANPDGVAPSTLTIMAKNISLDGGQILAETRGNVDASTVKIAAAGTQASAYGASDFDSTGFAANGNLTLANGAWINGNTYLSGNSASIAVKAGNLTLNGNGRSALIVSSTLNPGTSQAALATGDGGSIAVTASSLTLSKGGQIQSSTVTQGKAGAITVNSGSISIEGQQGVQTGIFATANQSSSGQAGTITLNAPSGAINITGNAAVTVQNDASVSAEQLTRINQTTLAMTGKSITLDSNAQVSASTGGNVTGSKIAVKSLGGDITIKNGAFIQGATTGSGNAAEIDVNASDNLFLTNGSYINGNTSNSGQAAALTIQAANITLDGNGKSAIISSEAVAGPNRAAATGSGNLVDITTPGTLSLINGGQIKSSSSSDGDAGMVHAHAGTILIDGQSNTSAMTGIFNVTTGKGDSKEITITASNDLTVKGLGQINATSTAPNGNAGAITIDTGSLTVDGMKAFSGTIIAPDGTSRTVNGYVFSNISSEAGTPSPGVTGDVTVTARETITLSNSGRISVSNLANVADPSAINSLPESQKPNLTLSAKSVLLDGDGQITASTSGSIDASKIKVTATGGNIELKNGGNIVGSTTGKGNAGVLEVTANGGSVSISNGGNIQSATQGFGKAGAVTVLADNILISGQMPGKQTGIFAAAYPNSGGQAGTLTLDASKGEISLTKGALVSVQNDATVGAEQLAKLTPTSLSMTAKSITFDSNTQILASTSGNVDASSINIKSLGGNVVIKNGAAVQGATTGSGDAAAIVVNAAGDLQLSNGAFINGNTSNSGKAASISIQATNVTLDGNGKAAIISSESNSPQLSPTRNGSGNLVDITASGDLTLLNGGQIKSSSNSYGDSGIVRTTAKNLVIDGQNTIGAMTGIFNVTTGRGDSKEIVITNSGDMTVKGLGQINATSTAPTGKAGAITIHTGNLTLDGQKSFSGKITLPDGTQRETNGFVFSNISSEAGTSSSGVTGDVTIIAKETIALSDGGRVSVSNLANVANPASINSVADNLKPNLTMLGKNISLSGNAMISAETRGNVDASKIKVAAAGTQATSLDTIDIDAASFVPAGNLTLGNRAAITGNTYASGKAASLVIKAGNATLDSATLSSSANFGASNDAGSIALTVPGTLLVKNGSTITTSTHAAVVGDAGDITASAGGVTLENNGSISSDAGLDTSGTPTPNSQGKAGSIMLDVQGTLAMNRSLIDTTTQSQGSAGKITIKAKDVSLTSASIQSNSKERQTGALGQSGKAGSIDIAASGDVLLISGAASTSTAIHSSTASDGAGGEVAVSAKNITLDTLGYANSLAGIMSLGMPGAPGVATGNAGAVSVTAGGKLSLLNSGSISTTALAQTGNAGKVTVKADTLVMNGSGSITSDTLGAGNAGSVEVSANQMIMDASKLSSPILTPVGNTVPTNFQPLLTKVFGQGTRVSSQAFDTAKGDAGQVKVTVVADLSVLNGGQISSATYSTTGAAKDVVVNAGSLLVDGTDKGKGSSISAASLNTGSSGQTGTVKVTTLGDTVLSNGGALSLRNDALVVSSRLGSITPTTLEIAAKNLSLDSGAQITAATSGNIAASNIKINAGGNLIVRNKASIQGATSNSGNAGTIEVTASGDLTMSRGGNIQDSTSGAGNAGSVTVKAGNIAMDGQNIGQTGVFSASNKGSSGHAGEIALLTSGELTMNGGSQLSVQNDAMAANGSTAVLSPSSLLVLARNIRIDDAQSQITASTSGNIDASNIKVAATGAQSQPANALNFATLSATGALSIGKGASISGNTSLSGKGGSVEIKAGTVTLDGAGGNAIISAESLRQSGVAAPLSATGDGGSVNLTASQLTLKDGGQIKTSTATYGNSGLATIAAESILIDGGGKPNLLTGIFGSTSGAGHSKEINVVAGKDLTIKNLGQISASTSAAGEAGSITVKAKTIAIDGSLTASGLSAASGINAEAGPASSGKTGNITVQASDYLTLSNGGMLSVQNYASVPAAAASVLNSLPQSAKSRISLSAPEITLKNASISAASSGNVNASNIDIAFTNRLYLDPSSIATSANTGDGGAIRIVGGKWLVLENSQITTSVSGLVGFAGNPANGGNINISADTLLMMTGFIQANTAARSASGGDVAIAAQNLVTSGNALLLGGQTPYSFVPYAFGFNVIQAAAPTGLSGAIRLTSPALDVSASLIGLNAKFIDAGGMGRSPCEITGGSSLVQAGRGGLPASARDLLGPLQRAVPDKVSLVDPSLMSQAGAAWGCKKG